MVEEKTEQYDGHLIQLVIGLQTTAWMALGKIADPATGKTQVNLELARDSIDTLLMLKEKTKGNLTETEKGILENAMQDLELNFIDVSEIIPPATEASGQSPLSTLESGMISEHAQKQPNSQKRLYDMPPSQRAVFDVSKQQEKNEKEKNSI